MEGVFYFGISYTFFFGLVNYSNYKSYKLEQQKDEWDRFYDDKHQRIDYGPSFAIPYYLTFTWPILVVGNLLNQ